MLSWHVCLLVSCNYLTIEIMRQTEFTIFLKPTLVPFRSYSDEGLPYTLLQAVIVILYIIGFTM